MPSLARGTPLHAFKHYVHASFDTFGIHLHVNLEQVLTGFTFLDFFLLFAVLFLTSAVCSGRRVRLWSLSTSSFSFYVCGHHLGAVPRIQLQLHAHHGTAVQFSEVLHQVLRLAVLRAEFQVL